MTYWNDRAVEYRQALEWLDDNLLMPAGVWLAMYEAVLANLKHAQRRVNEECEAWF